MIAWNNAHAASVEVSWNANPASDGVAGYRVYYGASSRVYTHIKDVGNAQLIKIGELQEGVRYYFAVTAYDTSLNESEYSNEASVAVPYPAVLTDNDSDGIPDTVEDSMGLDPYDPFDSIYDNDLDGFSNFSEYESGTDMNDFLSYPETDAYMIYMISEKGASVLLDGVMPGDSISAVPLSSDYPVPINLVMNFQDEGLFYYNLVNISGLVKYKLSVSVTGSILLAAETTPDETFSVVEDGTGIELEITEGSTSDDLEVGIGLTSGASGAQNLASTSGYMFDILPYGKVLKQAARIAVPYSGENPHIEIYDFTTGNWNDVEDQPEMNGGKAVFTTKRLGRFRISESSGGAIGGTETLSAEDDGSSGGGSGICFISSADLS